MTEKIYPILPKEVVVKSIDDKYLFLIPSKPDWVVVNNNCAYLLSLCDGTKSIQEIVSHVSNMHPGYKEAEILLMRLYESGFFDSNTENKVVNNALKGDLKSVHLNISENCNLSCKYCYANNREKKGNGLSLDEYKTLIDSLEFISPHLMIALTGGEPLLNPDFYSIAEYAKRKGHYIYLLTNGSLIDESNCKIIKSVVDEVRISIDGYYPETHDALRGFGTYKKAINAIELLGKEGVNIRIAMTVTSLNLNEIELMSNLYGGQLIYQPLFNAGGAKDHVNISINGLEYYEALNKAKNVNPLAGLGSAVNKLRGKGTRRCAIAKEEISISFNGDVYPCHMLHLDEFYCGNIRGTSIDEIYYSSQVLCEIRNQSIYTYAGCDVCPIRLLCGGACRARTYYMTGSLINQDDFCEYELMAYTDGLIKCASFGHNHDSCMQCREC